MFFELIKINIRYCVIFTEASNDKTHTGYIKDFESILNANLSFEIPMMTDNCATMIKALKTSQNSRKIYCAAHKLAKLDDYIHRIDSIKKLDYQIIQINAYFNYRSSKFELNLKPSTSVSATRTWRSHSFNYKTTLRNFEK